MRLHKLEVKIRVSLPAASTATQLEHCSNQLPQSKIDGYPWCNNSCRGQDAIFCKIKRPIRALSAAFQHCWIFAIFCSPQRDLPNSPPAVCTAKCIQSSRFQNFDLKKLQLPASNIKCLR